MAYAPASLDDDDDDDVRIDAPAPVISRTGVHVPIRDPTHYRAAATTQALTRANP